MPVEAWCRTDTGLRRQSNQDSYLKNRDLGLYVVADGMGGHSGGEVASSMAVKTMEEVVKSCLSIYPPMNPRDILSKAYNEACMRIFRKSSEEQPDLAGMGTTMVSVLVHGSNVFLANVGDSRAYLFSRPYLWQVSEDHSLVNEQVRSGMITEEQAKNFVAKNVITRSVGYERELVVDLFERPIRKGEYYILCSDGLSGLVTDARMAEILNENEPPIAVEELVNEALANGGDDNVTVMLVAMV
jgi:PPM family protein phosphatase